MSIPRDIIELVRARARIEEIIARYVPSLNKRGANYVGLCPFHKEKTPSFTVSSDKQMFYCFGCHTGGNVFSFISKSENLSFPQAVRFIGKIVGIEVRDEDEKKDSTVEDILRINEYTAKLYSAYLMSTDGVTGLEYLQKRGVSEDAIKTFRLGYAPDSWDFLSSRLKSVGADISKAAISGLLGTKDDSRYFDRYRNRIIFPIIDQYGSVAGFGGRVLGDGEPKYLNSPESPTYKKRTILYGYNLAKGEISQLKRAIIVEGYLDVIGCHQAGITNVVAPLGTALTEEQVRLLSRQCTEIILLFDADSAGIKASIRSLEVVKDLSIAVKVASLPEDDPFDYIQKKGVREFMAVVDSAMSPADYRIGRVLSVRLSDPIQTLLSLFDIVRDLSYESERQDYLKKIAHLTGYDYKTIVSDYQRYSRSGERPVITAKKAENDADEHDFIWKSHKSLIILLLHHPELMHKAVLDFSENDFTDKSMRSIFSILCELYNNDEPVTTDKLFDIFNDGYEKRFLEENVSLSYEINNPDDAYTEIYLNIRQHSFDKKIAYFADLIKRTPGDPRIKDFLVEVDLLRRKKEELSAYIYNMKNSASAR
jgi:DNA primase